MSSIYAPAPYAPDGGPTTTTPVGGGAQVVPLQDVLRVLLGTFTDPRTGAPAPLPAHRWDLQRADAPTVFVRSTCSDADGKTYLVKDPEIVAASPQDTWFLTLRPELSEADLVIARSAGEVWIDLEAKRWLSLWPRPTLEKRKLVRIPLWTSRWKAGCGGFATSFGARFAQEGLLETSDLRVLPSGPPTWEIRIDHGWHVTWVRFQHHDTAQKKTVSLPPGLCLEAIGHKRRIDGTEDDGLRVGAGTCLDDQGTIYVLHERTREQSGDVELSWSGLGDAHVVLDGDSPTERIRTGKPPDDPRTRYVLPDAFCSRGWEARLGTGPRRKWSTLRASAATSRATPVVFHLDDTVLVDFDTGPVAVEPDTRLILFDHRMAFRKPVDGVLPPFWTGRLSDNYLRAEEVVATDGDGFEETAFVIHREGDFFVLRDDRVRERDDTTPCIGARAALARSPQNPSHRYEKGTAPPGYGIGTAELHLFPDAYPGPYDPDREGKFLAENAGTMLCHLLVHVSFSIEPDPEGPADVAAAYGLLMVSVRGGEPAPSCARRAGGLTDRVLAWAPSG